MLLPFSWSAGGSRIWFPDGAASTASSLKWVFNGEMVFINDVQRVLGETFIMSDVEWILDGTTLIMNDEE